MKVRYAETALRELEEIFAFIAADNKNAAADVVERVEEIAAIIGMWPGVGHSTDEPNVLMFTIRPYRYRLFYIIENDEAIITHVEQGSRQFPWERV